ncbi:MAG: CRISPR-associated endonuclease Cas1 [Rhodospirillales bacterium]|nr:CRISPR-associated endonuclease Cas1 [Rhodospirillales bacterium]
MRNRPAHQQHGTSAARSCEVLRGATDETGEGPWAERSAFWREQFDKPANKRAAKQRERQPLILSGHGMGLRINHGALEVRNGFTHYPQTREQWRLFPGDPRLPSRIVLLDGSGAVTLDVLAWLAEQNIPLIQFDWRGNVVAAIGTNSLGADPLLLQRQVMAAENPKRSVAIAAWLVREKLRSSRLTLERMAPASAAREAAIARIEGEIARLGQPWAGSKTALLGLEGKCAEVYFNAWRAIPLAWKGTDRRPIPDTWRAVGIRGTSKGRRNRFARHPVQAMLNYGYAVLESQVRIETARVGLDLATGFLHEMRSDRPALILDLMEPLRPAIDASVLGFATAQTFTPADFTIGRDGTCRLHPQLARRVVAEIGPIEVIPPILAALLDRIGHKPPPAIPHRSKAWLAQKGLLSL